MKISANKFLDDCHPSTEWRGKKIPESEKPVDGSFFLFPDVVHRTICRSEDCGASVTKAFWEGNPWLVYFQKLLSRTFSTLLLCGYKINDFQWDCQVLSLRYSATDPR